MWYAPPRPRRWLWEKLLCARITHPMTSSDPFLIATFIGHRKSSSRRCNKLWLLSPNPSLQNYNISYRGKQLQTGSLTQLVLTSYLPGVPKNPAQRNHCWVSGHQGCFGIQNCATCVLCHSCFLDSLLRWLLPTTPIVLLYYFQARKWKRRP